MSLNSYHRAAPAHGTRNFCFEVAERALEQGIVPSTISTDLTTLSIFGPVYSLAETMSKFVILGLDITEVIKMTTINPARALGMDSRLGGLKVGAPADVSIFELKDCEKEFVDSVGDTRQGRVALIPLATIKSGQVIYADPFPSSGAVSRC